MLFQELLKTILKMKKKKNSPDKAWSTLEVVEESAEVKGPEGVSARRICGLGRDWEQEVS